MITRFEKICPVCGEKFFWTNPKEDPEVCYKRMCQTNYRYQQGHITGEGYMPTFKDIAIWKGSKGLTKK